MQLTKPLRIGLIVFLALHISLIMPAIGLAQQYQQGMVSPNIPPVQKVGEGNQYYLGQANELLIRVNVWGKVQRPGQYFVPATTDLITLLSVAGGPISKSRLTDVQVVRPMEEGNVQVMSINIKKYLKTGDKRLIPDLRPEDTVVVNGSLWQLFADVVDVAAKLAIIGNVYYFFFIAGNE